MWQEQRIEIQFFSEDCIKLCYSKNSQMAVKWGLKHNAIQNIDKIIGMYHHYQKANVK